MSAQKSTHDELRDRTVEKWIKRAEAFRKDVEKLGVKCKLRVEVRGRASILLESKVR